MKRYLLSHDLGTSGNKAALFSIEGALVNTFTSGYGTRYFNNNWAEQNPLDWWKGICDSTRGLLKGIDPREIACVSFSGQMMGCLCVDEAGVPLKNHILYCDQRAVEEERRILSRISARDFYRITGHRASASYSVCKLMWVKNNEPEVYRKTFKMLHAKDYAIFRLTGRMVTDYTDACGTTLLDLDSRTWSEKLIDITGIDGEKLPELVASTEVVGEVTREAASATGLKMGTPVVAGAGDGMCAGVGAGSVKPGLTYNYLGSSAWVATTTEKPIYDEEMRTFVWAHAVPGYVHPCGTMQTAGSSYSWLKNEIAYAESLKAEQEGTSPYELIDKEIETSPPGSRGIIFLPYLLGERTPRWNPDAQGAFIGINLGHKRADIMRSVLEGVSFNLAIIVDIFRKQVPIHEITVIGGGAKGKIWREILADIYEADILKPNYLEEATSIGAAIIGGVGAGVFSTFDVIDRFLKIESRQKPDSERVSRYRKMKPVFDDCYYALTGIYQKLKGL
ncbi:MAG: xylulokinase [Spirochaetota bacterium]